MKTLWHCCRNCKISPQDCKPLEAKEEPDPHTKAERLDSSRHGRTASHPPGIGTTSLESSMTESIADSSGDTLDSSAHTLPSVQSEQNTLLDVETIVNVMECSRSGEKSFLENCEQKIGFLRAISVCCRAAQESGQGKLDIPYSKAELTEAILMVMETLPVHSVPSSILSCSMLAIYNLSKIKPPLDSELESCILRLALHGVFNMETEPADSHRQALYKSSSDTMEIMLKGLLAEDPTMNHLLFILEHINFWINSKDSRERSRAIKCSTSLLQHAVSLPGFNKCSELPALGHYVAQVGICVIDSAENVSRQAREAISCLYELLLHQMGLSMNEATELWFKETEGNKMILPYINACRVGEVFRKIFTEDQKRTFLQTALLAIYDPLLRTSEAGLLLVYSLLGKTKELLGEEAAGMKKKIFKQLYMLRTHREVPEALQGLFPS